MLGIALSGVFPFLQVVFLSVSHLGQPLTLFCVSFPQRVVFWGSQRFPAPLQIALLLGGFWASHFLLDLTSSIMWAGVQAHGGTY